MSSRNDDQGHYVGHIKIYEFVKRLNNGHIVFKTKRAPCMRSEYWLSLEARVKLRKAAYKV